MPKFTKVDPKWLSRIKKQVAELGNQRLTVSEWLDRMEQIDPIFLETGLDGNSGIQGIWTGEKGESHFQIGDTRYWVLVQWYNKKVEVCYVS